MKERLESLMGKQQADRLWAGTFHQLGSRILEMFENHGLSEPRTNILTEDGAMQAFRKAVSSAGVKCCARRLSVPCGKQVSILKQNLCDPNDATSDPILSRAYEAYEGHLRTASAWDLDDLLFRPVKLLRENPSEARTVSRTIGVHLLVDEFQDVNRAQVRNGPTPR